MLYTLISLLTISPKIFLIMARQEDFFTVGVDAINYKEN